LMIRSKMIQPNRALAGDSRNMKPPRVAHSVWSFKQCGRVSECFRLNEPCPRCKKLLTYWRQYDRGKFTRAYVQCRGYGACGFEQPRSGTLASKTILKEKVERSYRLYPTAGKTLNSMMDGGIFIVNPKNSSGLPPASMYFEREECSDYIKTHPDSIVWTVIEEDDKLYLVEGYRIINRLAYMIESPEKSNRLKAIQLVCKHDPRTILLSDATKNNSSRRLQFAAPSEEPAKCGRSDA